MVKTGRQLRYEWQREIRRYRLGQPTKSVAQHLALYADADGMNVRPGVAQLAAECELGESTVRKALKELERIKVIVLVHGGSDFGRRAVASEYRLVLPDDLADRLELVERKPTKAPTRKTKAPGSLSHSQ